MEQLLGGSSLLYFFLRFYDIVVPSKNVYKYLSVCEKIEATIQETAAGSQLKAEEQWDTSSFIHGQTRLLLLVMDNGGGMATLVILIILRCTRNFPEHDKTTI